MPAIKTHHTDISEGAWDGPGNVAKLRSGEDEGYYRQMFAWQDPEADPETKAAWKFPHHEVSADGEPGAANVKGCQSGIGVLNGAMGGAKIPDSDRQGVYNHLAAHLEDADVEPADLRSQPKLIVNEMGIERRYVVGEVRVITEEDDTRHIRGYGAVFNELSEDLGGMQELIEPGAFTKTLQEADVRSLWNHNADYVLGRNISGTLELFEDKRGLGYDVTPPDAQWARDLMASIERGDVSGSSFGFCTVRDKWDQDEDGKVTRRLLEVKLFDVGPVTFPAYPQTSVQVRSKLEEYQRSTVAPGQEPHATDADDDLVRARLEIMRRRVELAERL